MPQTSGSPGFGDTPHGTIYINGNSDLASAANGGGDGSASNPYIIENYAISAASANGIDIRNTTAYFIVRNCLVENGGDSYSGIYLENVINGRIENNTCSNNNEGISLEESDNNTLTNNTCRNNGSYGIYFTLSENNILQTNTYENSYGIPGISGVNYSNVTQNSATITWTTAENSTSIVEYGTTQAYGYIATDGTTTSHSVGLSSLSAETTYHYRVRSTDNENNTEISSDNTFTTSSSAPPPPPTNNPPTAEAGGPYSVQGNSTVQLNGTGSSDPDGDTLSYSWTITNDPTGAATLTNASTATPTFHAPAVGNTTVVTVRLVVDDGHGHPDDDTATVTIQPAGVNQPPTAEAGGPYSVQGNSTVQLNGTGSSDPDGDTLTYS